MELSKTLSMPVKNRENIIRFVIGGILDIIPVLNLLSSGYAFVLLRKHIFENASEDLPEWEHWGTLFKYGILTFLISLGYLIIPLAIIGLGVAAEATHIAILEYVGVTFDVIGGLSFLAALFFFPMGIIVFGVEDEFSAAFTFFRVIDLTFKHIGLYLKAFIVLLVMGIISGFLSMIPLVGWIVSVFVGFYILLESALLLGDVGQAIAGKAAGPVVSTGNVANAGGKPVSEPLPATEGKDETEVGETPRDASGEKGE